MAKYVWMVVEELSFYDAYNYKIHAIASSEETAFSFMKRVLEPYKLTYTTSQYGSHTWFDFDDYKEAEKLDYDLRYTSFYIQKVELDKLSDDV